MRRIMRTRYLYGFAAAALILAMVGVAIMLSAQRFRDDSRWVSHTYDVLRKIEQVRSTLLVGLISQRNYLLTGKPEQREVFLRARPQVRAQLAALSVELVDNPRQAARLSEMSESIEQRLDLATENLHRYEQQGLTAVRTALQQEDGRSSALLKARIAEISRAEQELLDVRTARSQRSAQVLLVAGAAGIPLSLAILLWIYVLLSREVRQRTRAERGARQLNAELGVNVGELQRASADLRELSRYAGLLQTCRDVPEALDITRRTLSSLLPESAGSVYLLRASQDYAEIEISWGEHAAGPHVLMMPHKCWALRRSQVHCVDNLADGMHCNHLDLPGNGVASTACLPLTAQGMSLGMLYLSCPMPGPLPHIAVASAAAEQFSLALSNLRLQESLRQQSIRDALSGLYNRRYLLESLPRELARAQRRGQSLALMMFDLDHFKAFNDAHGHDGGDAILAAFGRLLQSMCREEDIPCRYGGEEFTLILPETDLAVAERRAEEIRTAVETMTVRHLQRDIGHLTVSIGLAMSPLHSSDADELQRLADSALYRAKRAGRNRLQLASKD